MVAVAKVLDVDNKLDATYEDIKILSLKANQEVQTFLSAKWDIVKAVEVTGQRIAPMAKFIIYDTKTLIPCLKDGKIERSSAD
jgi:hypothetical protein